MWWGPNRVHYCSLFVVKQFSMVCIDSTENEPSSFYLCDLYCATLFIGIYKEPLTSSDLSIQGSLDYSNVLHTNFFQEPLKERFFGEPKMVLLWHRYENPFIFKSEGESTTEIKAVLH